MKRKRRIPFGIVLSIAVCFSILLFWFSYLSDNKYTYDNGSAKMGITVLDMDDFTKNPLVFLVDGWEFYDGVLLTPESINQQYPDEYFYIGRYSGFDRGNPQKSPYGCGTYRMTVITDETERVYALELPEIYSEWQLFINGSLKHSVGVKEKSFFPPQNWIVTFEAKDQIEIVINVSSYKGLYNGFTFPPAFGSAQKVGNYLALKLIMHIGSGTIAVFIGILCILIGFSYRYAKPYHLLFFLCLSYMGMISYPFVQAFGLTHSIFSIAERLGYYSFILVIVLLQASLIRLPKRIWVPIVSIGAVLCLAIPLQPYIYIQKAQFKYIYSAFLTLYKYSIALWLLLSSAWAVYEKKQYSKPLLLGVSIFSTALVFDRVFPLFEPIRFGWPIEIGGFIMILIIGGILWRDSVQVYKDSLALESQKNVLIEANQLKSEFLSNISHELQMPLTVVSGYAQLSDNQLQDKHIDIEELRDYQKQIVIEAERMERLVLQLLDLSRIENGTFQLDLEAVNLMDFAEQVAELYFPMLDENSNEIYCDIPYDLYVYCDKERILQVFINLISNACRHTQNGEITLTAQQRKGEAIIVLRDTGKGIAPELLPHLFERYLKNNQGAMRAAGTGLGLYLCKQIVIAHKGTIFIESEVGKGTAVILTLPLGRKGMESGADEYE